MGSFLSIGDFDVVVGFASSSCICGSEGEEELRAFLSKTSRLAVSVRLGIMLGCDLL